MFVQFLDMFMQGLCKFHPMNRRLNAINTKHFQLISLVGAVGIEPTTPPV